MRAKITCEHFGFGTGRQEDAERRLLPDILQAEDDIWQINAGAIHGLTINSILAVHPPPGQPRAEKPLGHVRITPCRRLDAAVEACAFGGVPVGKEGLPDGGVCELVVVDHGELRLRVAVDRADHAGRPVPDADFRRLCDDLRGVAAPADSLLRFEEESSRADWLVRLDAGGLYVVPAAGIALPEPGGRLPAQSGPAPADEPWSAWLKRRLPRIARFENLKRLAASQAETARGSGAVRVELELRLLRDQADREGVPIRFEAGPPTFYHGDRIAFRVRNPHRFPLDVTLLYLDCGFGIDPLFPVGGELNRLEPGEEKVLRASATTTTPGQEHLAVIAVRGTSVQPADFSALAQPPVERSGGGPPGPLPQELDSPLGRLLANALQARGTTRSLPVQPGVLDMHTMRLLSWHIVPAKRPAPR